MQTTIEELEGRRADLARQVEGATQEANAAQAAVASDPTPAAVDQATQARAKRDTLAEALRTVSAQLDQTRADQEAQRQATERQQVFEQIATDARDTATARNQHAAAADKALRDMDAALKAGVTRYLEELQGMEQQQVAYEQTRRRAALVVPRVEVFEKLAAAGVPDLTHLPTLNDLANQPPHRYGFTYPHFLVQIIKARR
jgi:hypothetical protein